MSQPIVAMPQVDTLTSFAMTPGELLGRVLDDRDLEKTDFGKSLGTNYQTILRWTRDEGFNTKNQRRAALKLNLEPDYFSKPFDDDRARAREAYRRKVFSDFLESDLGKRLAISDPAVIKTLDSTPFPAGRRPTVDAFIGLALVFTRQLDPEEAEAAIRLNESLSASLKQTSRKKGPRKPR